MFESKYSFVSANIYVYVFYLKCFSQSDINYSQLNKFADPTENSSSKRLTLIYHGCYYFETDFKT